MTRMKCRSGQVGLFGTVPVQTVLAVSAISPPAADSHEPHVCPDSLADSPGLSGHIDQYEIIAGLRPLDEVLDAGRRLFNGPLNACDGYGRPTATGDGERRSRGQPMMVRTSSPEATSCVGCHNQPGPAGAGDFAANVFVLAEAIDPVTDSVAPSLSDERNTIGLFGAGVIELLAREMSADLQEQAVMLPARDSVTRGGTNSSMRSLPFRTPNTARIAVRH